MRQPMARKTNLVKTKKANPLDQLDVIPAVENMLERKHISSDIIRTRIRRASRRLQQGLGTEIQKLQKSQFGSSV